MKSHVRLFLLLFITETAYGQLEKGQGLLTGSFNASFTQYKFGTGTSKTNQTQSATTVSYGKFVRNNVLLGAAISLSGNQTKNITDQAYAFTVKSYGTSEAITPFARYYWQYGKLLMYAGGGFTLSGGHSGFAFDNNSSKGDSRNFSASLEGQAGIIYPLSNRIGIDVFARSSGLPVSGSTAGIGLLLFTGAGNQLTTEDTLTNYPQLSRSKIVLSTGFSTTSRHQTSTSPQDSGVVNAEYMGKETMASIGVGYFIRDRTQIGIYGSYTFNNARSSSQAPGYATADNNSANYVSVTAYIRRYMSKRALTPYAGGSLSLQSSKISGPATFGYVGRLGAGLAYLVGKRFIIEAELINVQGSYSKIAPANDGSVYYAATHQLNTTLNATLRPNFGLSYTL